MLTPKDQKRDDVLSVGRLRRRYSGPVFAFSERGRPKGASKGWTWSKRQGGREFHLDGPQARKTVSAALTQGSRVWFTISHGIVNEIYYPRVDQACVRDLGFIVTDGDAFFAEVKRDCETVVERIEDGVPAFRLTSTYRGGRVRMINQVIANLRSDSIVLHIRLEDSAKTGLRLFALLAPHLVNAGAHNSGRLGEYKGHDILCAVGAGTHLAMLGSPSFLARSVGFVCASDGWRQLRDHGRLIDQYDSATDGNVALSAELAMGAAAPRFWRSDLAAPRRRPPITRGLRA